MIYHLMSFRNHKRHHCRYTFWVRGVEEVLVGGVGVGAGGWVCRTCKHQPIFHLDPKILELLLCMYFKGLPQEIKQNYHGFPLVF